MSSATLASPQAIASPTKALPRFAAITLGSMVLVILEGAVVRATGSGAGCGNHWPLCNGEVIPHHPRLATIIEFVHRQLTTVITLLVATLILWTFRATPRHHRARRTATWCGILLLTEAFLGAVLVKGGYVEANAASMRVFMQCIHFTNTMLLMAALTLTWWWLNQHDTIAAPPAARSIAWLTLISTIVVGATGSVAALADTLFPAPSLRFALAQDFSISAPLLIRMRWLHPAAAVISLVCAILLSLQLKSRTGTRIRAWIVALSGTQLLLGAADVLLLAPTWLQVLHLLGADLYWIALVAAGASILLPDSESAPSSTTAQMAA